MKIGEVIDAMKVIEEYCNEKRNSSEGIFSCDTCLMRETCRMVYPSGHLLGSVLSSARNEIQNNIEKLIF